ncbi:MAG: hypothetical protein H5U40_11210, partial [Polyangiaceae bacterium]|nr:hypothetical protein [Polyangiaceae bacterium]
VEREIAQLEAAHAPGDVRARAWIALGALWQRGHGSLAEAARAYREASAADPTNVQALKQAARLCAAIGQLDLAEAYSSAAVAATEGLARAESLVELARYAERGGRSAEAINALRAATRLNSENAELWSRLSRALRATGERNAAVEAGVNAVSLWADLRPQAALGECEGLLELAPTSRAVLSAYAQALAADGRAAAAVAWLADGVRSLANVAERQQHLLDAAELAESAGRTDLSAELLLEAFDLDPSVEAFHDALALDAESGLSREDAAVVLEAIAAAAPPSRRGEWLDRAAIAHTELAGGGDWALILQTRALCADPELSEPLEALRRTAESTGDPALLADALERAIRVADGPTAH